MRGLMELGGGGGALCSTCGAPWDEPCIPAGCGEGGRSGCGGSAGAAELSEGPGHGGWPEMTCGQGLGGHQGLPKSPGSRQRLQERRGGSPGVKQA